ncbi:MAG TPA: hypothetical protein VF144_22225, partial [Chitinophagaceae bacterium]
LIWQNNTGTKKEIISTDSQKRDNVITENNDQTKTNGHKNNTPAASYQTDKLNTEASTKIPAVNSFDRPIDQETGVDAPVAKVGKNKTTNPEVKKTVQADQTIDNLVKNTEPERSVIEKLTKNEPEPATAERKDLTKESVTEKTPTENNKPESNKIEEQKETTNESKPVAIEKTDAKKQKKNGSSFANNFFVTVSAGPDLSGVGGNAGEVRLAYGAGIGYQVSKKFSIRTGFYAARKVYTADPEDYNPPYNIWAYYPNLKNIDANCMVYEIPVTVDYKISSNKKQSWFVSAGLSSLLMKEETYEYYFKPNSSPTYITYTKKINNQNKHYFSVLNLSGGYTRVLNKNISLQAEPYVKLAMDGVGYGKVDLNSGGILFSAIIKPFAKK